MIIFIGVWLEVGKFCEVMVCELCLVYCWFILSNCRELFFDDVLWVEKV